MLQVSYISPDGKCIEHFEMADGMTLEQAAITICPDSAGKFPVPTIAIVGAKPAVRELGDWDFPLHSANIQFRQLALGGGGGGGSNPVQMVLQIAIIAAAVAASVLIPGLGTFAGGATLLGLEGATWGAIAGAGIMLMGTMLMGALFPQKLPQGQLGAMSAEQASPTYSINASGNQARLYQQEPEAFGRMKIVPDFVANTWTIYIDNDQIGYFVYGIGRGHYEIESLQFGETVFWRNGELVEDSGYEIQEIEFVEPGNPVTIFPDNIITSQEVSGQELFAPNDEEFDGAIGPYATNAPGTKTNKLLFDFVFQQGLGRYDDNGKLREQEVKWRLEYRRIDDFGNALSDWAILDEPSEKMATLTPQRITKQYDVAEGRYEVRAIRISDTNANGRTLDTLIWGAMRAMLPGTYEYPISCIAFSIKANNALTQNASRQFSAIVTRKLPLYDRAAKTWSEEIPTRSWAAAVSHVAKCEWGGRLPDSSIDLDTLWRIDEELAAKGWFYDSYIDGPTLVWTLLCEMCQSQCVICRLVGPVLSFVQDAPDRKPSFALTPRNIVRDSFQVIYSTWSDDTPDDVTVEYLDSAYGFQQRDVTAKLPESESREPSSLDILGITDRDHAHKVAVAYAAHNRWQRISVECQVEALGRIINRGDICTVAHPRFKNTSSGIVKGWDEKNLKICIHADHLKENDDGFYIDSPYNPGQLLRLDDHFLESAGNFVESAESSLFIDPDIAKRPALSLADGEYLSLMRPDGSIWGPCKLADLSAGHAAFDQGDYSTLLLQGQGNPFEWLTRGIDRQPTIWTLYEAKEYQRLMVVDSINTQDAIHFNLKLLNYDERIYQYSDLPVPAWQGRGQLPQVESIGSPQNLRGTALSASTLVLAWLGVAGAQWYEVETSVDGQSWQNRGRANVGQITLEVSPGVIFARVRAANEQLASGWALWHGDTTLTAPASPVLTLAGAYRGGAATVSWQAVSGATGYAVSLRSGSSTIYAARTTSTSFNIDAEMQEGGPYRNLVVAVSAFGPGGASAESQINLQDSPPNAPTNAQFAVNGNAVSLISVSPAMPTDGAGYLIVKGTKPDFGLNEVLEMREAQLLPYSWGNLSAGAHYFRCAIFDEFWQIARNPYNLNWSACMEITIGGANG